MTPDARERFLRAIAEQIPAERIAEVHLFPPLRQGGRETGVAVVAVFPEASYVQGELPPPVGSPAGADDEGASPVTDSGHAAAASRGEEAEGRAPGDSAQPHEEAGEQGDAVLGAADDAIDAGVPPRLNDDAARSDEPHRSVAEPIGRAPRVSVVGAPPQLHDASVAADEPHPLPADTFESVHAEAAPSARRLIIYRAAYRWTRKGADRGRWEVELRAEADAPLETVGDVVRGVHRRAGGEAEPERLGGDEVRAAISDRPWAASR